jgi:hypothetical protein
MLIRVSDRLSPPGPSIVDEVRVPGPSGPYRAGIARPTTLTDDWWVTLLWVADEDGVIPLRALASAAGPPADPPLARLGPSIAGHLSGLILEESGRQMLRLRLGVAPDDERSPWEAPLIVVAAFRWEPMRAATTPGGELAAIVLAAFARSLDSLARR